MDTMSSSTFGIPPSLLDNSNSGDETWPSLDPGVAECSYLPTQTLSATSFTSHHHLSPSSHIPSNSASPTLNESTPADSLSVNGEQYQASELSDHPDPFFGVDFDDFNEDESAPGFLNDQIILTKGVNVQSEPSCLRDLSPCPGKDAPDSYNTYLLSPDPTNPSIHTTSPGGNIESPVTVGQTPPESVTRAHLKTLRSVPSDSTLSQRAPHSHSGTDTTRSSEDGMASTTAPMPSPSPRVTVSMWGRDQTHMNGGFGEDMISPADTRGAGISTDDNYIPASYQRASAGRAEETTWFTGAQAPRRGWAPEERSIFDSVSSINELKSQSEAAQRRQAVNRWMASAEDGVDPAEAPSAPNEFPATTDGISQQEIPLGGKTENKPLSGQIYYTERGGMLEEGDRKLMRENRVWADPPMLYRITKGDEERTQPETSAAAMARYDQMFHETSSVLSRSATWGTRRRSLPSISDIEGVTSGNFLKKLSISRERKPSILFKELRGLVRRPSASQLLKRSRGTGEDDGSGEAESQGRRESRDTLAPPRRTSSWTKKQQMPSLNTALVSMATGAAAFGTTHARTGSISNTTSPKSPFNLQVKNSFLRRPRSKSDLPRGASASGESHSNLVEMWKKTGGPPVAQLARGTSLPDRDDDDDDDDDDMNEEGEMRAMGSNIIDDISPNLAGFKQQVLKSNPRLAEHNTYLVDRIAHQQVVRYKLLLHNRIKHLQHIGSRSCPSGQMCIAMGGSAIQMDSKGETRALDPLSATYEVSDEDMTPLEGAITPESFPTDIPMPPTTSLPAEFECQLCYHTKKFTKPSDWTKHVHEDVQPFTCTWDRCRDPKIFKRKADWVRHENEGHRVRTRLPLEKRCCHHSNMVLYLQHLEWWTCDVEECKHTCYRRDNFLQHLVREHKFPEPKVKTKAAIKRAGALDSTWQKVEKCHVETAAKPQDEPCRFCGKTLPSWKKLTVHLAKHMETMSLPILRLVERKELDADTIISPVQDPPPRTFPPVKTEAQAFNVSPHMGQSSELSGAMAFSSAQHPPYYHSQAGAFPSSFYDSSTATMHGLQQPAVSLGIHQPVDLGAGFTSPAQAQAAAAAAAAGYHQTHHQSMPASSAASSFMASNQYISLGQQVEPFPAFMNPLGLQDASGNSIYDNATATLDTVGAGQTGDGHPQHQQHQHHQQHQQQQHQQQYSRHGGVPPYTRSPLHGHSSFFHQQRGRHG